MSIAAMRARAEQRARVERGQGELQEASEALRMQRQRRAAGALTCRSVEAVLEWWGAAVVRLQGAQGMHPRSEAVPTAAGNGAGERCVVRVDGGPGGDLDDVHATLETVRRALARLGREAERRAARTGRPPSIATERYHVLLVDHHVHGVSVEDLAKREGTTSVTMWRHLGRAEQVLAGLLVGVVT